MLFYEPVNEEVLLLKKEKEPKQMNLSGEFRKRQEIKIVDLFLSFQEWQKLNYDIYTLRQMRREVRNRWKRILEDLGFQKEADTLLSVTKRSIVSDSQNMSKAREFLLKLSEETTIFPTSWELSERYLFVVDRLIALDAADEFFRIASITYPKRVHTVHDEDRLKTAQCNSALS
ncbi:hypothetical protein JD844_023317 [Phrynosoma platyrhinos]|uniref:Melanoregulin n=1 Tax=Phrynosoma platyrhinos TaxID=52577 RepID=A0ABQ7SWA6_PHRPL|nr:hypothetical protein JD844_023317 [Phrynosoma platyrhinos]